MGFFVFFSEEGRRERGGDGFFDRAHTISSVMSPLRGSGSGSAAIEVSSSESGRR